MRKVLTTVLSLVLASTTFASQHALKIPEVLLEGDSELTISNVPSSDFSDTIVSILSASTEHTILLHLLQRSKSIPMLAHIGSATVFAPTDKAWEDWAERNRPENDTVGLYADWLGPGGLDEWRIPENEDMRNRVDVAKVNEEVRAELDNQNWALRQHLLYHMLNYTLSPSDFESSASENVTTHTTLLFPLADEPSHPRVPPPGAPWLPRGGDGMLGKHGQRLRFARAGSEEGEERGRVGGDWKGEGGFAVWDGKGWGERDGNETHVQVEFGAGREDRREKAKIKGVRWGTNGAVVGIDGVLDTPRSIEEIIQTHPSLSYLSRLLLPQEPLPSPLPANLSRAEHMTLFAPSNEALDAAFDDVEKRYLEGEFGIEGVARVVSAGVLLGLGHDGVGWRDYWSKSGKTVEAASGDELKVEAPPNGSLIVNGTEAQAIDIFASNGVIHIMPSLILPENFTLLNSAEKVLLSHNATRFVSLLRTANLSTTYAGERGSAADQPWIILAPTDDVLNKMERWGGSGPSLPGLLLEGTEVLWDEKVSPLAALLQYHILPGRLLPEDIEDGMLVGTELRPTSLSGERQRLRVEVSERFDRHRSGWDAVDAGEITFDGATVLGKPVRSGKSVIYLISSLISPPEDVLQTAVADLQLSTFIAAVYAADLERTVKNSPATTWFIPRNKAFSSLGLTMRYLLSSEGKDELREIVKYHAVDRILYTQDIDDGRETYKTLHGGEVALERTKGKNYTISLQSPSKWEGHDSGDDLPANGEIRPAIVTHADSLTSTGAIHIIDSVVMPADVEITIGKLIRGSKQSTMVDLMSRAGLDWILDGREPTRDELYHARLTGIVEAWDNDTATLPDLDSLALPAYTVLCPSDKAFSRINMTLYLSDLEALTNLLKLHIVPTQPTVPRTNTRKTPAPPPRDGSPISLADDLVFQTLLSSSSSYGDVAFRATGDNSFIVGIRNARSGYGNDVARLGLGGRASVRWRKSHTQDVETKRAKEKKGVRGGSDAAGDVLWRGGMTVGGGVIMLDAVLIPYEPSWLSRWGWSALVIGGITVIVIGAAGAVAWWWIARGKREEEREGYEPLEGEEEE